MLKLGIVVGHTAKAPGARLNTATEILQKYNYEPDYCHEYDYGCEVAKMILSRAREYGVDAKKFLRDGIGIIGAHELAESWGAKVVVELHFNSHADETIQGAEVLTTKKYAEKTEFSEVMIGEMVNLFGGKARDVKFPENREEEGHPNVTRPVPTFLLEPFFGSNPEQAEKGLQLSSEYAKAILQTAKKCFDLEVGGVNNLP